MEVFEVGSLRPGLLVEFEASVGAVATFPGETRLRGKVLRCSFENAGPIISAFASHTLECIFYGLLAPQMTTEAEVLPPGCSEIPTGSQEKDLA